MGLLLILTSRSYLSYDTDFSLAVISSPFYVLWLWVNDGNLSNCLKIVFHNQCCRHNAIMGEGALCLPRWVSSRHCTALSSSVKPSFLKYCVCHNGRGLSTRHCLLMSNPRSLSPHRWMGLLVIWWSTEGKRTKGKPFPALKRGSANKINKQRGGNQRKQQPVLREENPGWSENNVNFPGFP